MKSIKEKQFLVNLAKALGQNADPSLVKEINSFNNIKKDAHESIKRSALKDLSEAFKKAKLENEVQQIMEYPLPPTLDEVLTLIEEEKPEDELVQTQPEETPITEESPISLPEPTLAERAAKVISEAPKKDSFQQPEPDPVEKNFTEIQRKLKFLEATIGKIAIAGPGSGETKFRFLDDVDRDTITDSEHVLRYRPAAPAEYGKFFFGQLVGDHGPIRSMLYDTRGHNANVAEQAGLTAWNPSKDCLDIYQADGSVLQTGLENYIRVYNETANTITHGTFVQFAGVNGDGAETPIAIPFLNNANTIPLYAIGVVTTDMGPNSYGRATVLGEVRNVNTTGNTSGESWQVGDILWAKPGTDNAGKLTKIKPTAPNVAISVAAVLRKDSSNGILLARPTIWPRLYYASFSDTTTQTAANVNYGYAVRFNTTDIASGFRVSANTRIVAENSGLYNYQFSMQILSTNSSGKDMYVWPRKNGVNIPNSTTKKTVTGNQIADVLAWNFVISMNANDYFELVWATTDITVRLDAPTEIGFAPDIPSIILTVSEIAL